jgi:putative membrane protein
MKFRNGLFLVAAVAALAGCNRAGDATDETVAGDDMIADEAAPAPDAGVPTGVTAAEFVEQAGEANLLEVRASELVQQQAQDPDVQALARQMVEDHAAALEQLRGVAGGLAVPSALDASGEAKLDDLRSADPARVAADYLAMLEQDHQRAIALFEAYARDGEDAALKDYAAQTLPKLREHLDHVREVRAGATGDDTLGRGGGADDDGASLDPPMKDPLPPDPADPVDPDADPIPDGANG